MFSVSCTTHTSLYLYYCGMFCLHFLKTSCFISMQTLGKFTSLRRPLPPSTIHIHKLCPLTSIQPCLFPLIFTLNYILYPWWSLFTLHCHFNSARLLLISALFILYYTTSLVFLYIYSFFFFIDDVTPLSVIYFFSNHLIPSVLL